MESPDTIPPIMDEGDTTPCPPPQELIDQTGIAPEVEPISDIESLLSLWDDYSMPDSCGWTCHCPELHIGDE